MKPLKLFHCLLMFPILLFARLPDHTHSWEGTVGPHSGTDAFLSAHMVDDQLYLTIPEAVLDRPMLLVRYDPGAQRHFLQIVWSLEGDKMLLKVPRIQSSAGTLLPIGPQLALKDNVLGIFPLEHGVRASGSLVVNITQLVLHRTIAWKTGFTENLVPDISLLLGAKNFGDEVIIKTRRGIVMGKSSIAVPIFFGFCALPEPMKGRSYDYRMGYYDEAKSNFHFWLKNRPANITRWRLEKKFPDQKVSVPVRPLTFLISPGVPKKWRPYVKAGIEDWSPAFEGAGFKDALRVVELDSLDEWTAHSIHSNIIYWSEKKYLRGSEEEEYGGTVAEVIDLRSGEILRGDIYLGASVQNEEEMYFVRAAPLDPRTQQFPFPDTLIGAFFRGTTAHETGHVFGLMDSNYGEYTYPWNKMRDSLWLRKMGHTPSIMNYTRASNIPQPEDSISPSLLLQKVGPTDRYNILWAYKEFAPGTTPERERDALEKIIRWQDSIPWYRFNSTRMEVIGPGASDEVVETNDPIKSTQLALKNLERVIGLLPKVVQDQNDNGRLERLYRKTMDLWYHHMVHVSTLIGGYDIQYKSINQPGNAYTPIPWEEQMAALQFLITHAFDPPNWLTQPDFWKRTRFSTFPDPCSGYEKRLILDLVSAPRMKRLEALEQVSGNHGLVQKYLGQLQNGLFKELRGGYGEEDSRREDIQLAYIEFVMGSMAQKQPLISPMEEEAFFVQTNYTMGIMKQQLEFLKKSIGQEMKRKKDRVNMGHWQRCLDKLNGLP